MVSTCDEQSDGDLMFGEYVLCSAVHRISDVLLWSLLTLKMRKLDWKVLEATDIDF